MKSLKYKVSIIKNPEISFRNPDFRDFTYRTYKTYKTYQFASSKKGNTA